MFATLSAFADKWVGVCRDALATFDAFVIFLLFVLSDPLMAAAFGAAADKGMGACRDALATFDAFVLYICHNGAYFAPEGKRGQVKYFASASLKHGIRDLVRTDPP
jgi:hypothetical protein